MDIIPYYRGSIGLNIIDSPTRVSLDLETGMTQMTEALNVSLDITGQIKRRSGFSKIASGVFHSLFSDGITCLTGRSTDLLQIGPDLSLNGVRSGLAGLPITYTKTGNAIAYCNGGEKGLVKDGLSSPWIKGIYGGPSTIREFSTVPFADHITFFGGRTFVALGKVLYWSELHRPDLFDFSKNMHQFTSKISLLTAVSDGLFVSDQVCTYFLRAQGNPVFKQELVGTFPALADTLAQDSIEAIDAGFQVPGLCRIWGSTKGVILGLPTGQIFNLNGHNIDYTGLTGVCGGLLGDLYIHQMNAKTYALNYRTRSTTEYTNFQFNSIVNFNGYTLAAADTGLYQLGTDFNDDNGTGIDCSVKFKKWDFGIPNTKRIRYAYLGIDTPGTFIFNAKPDNGAELSYRIDPKLVGLQGTRITLASTAQGRYWIFGVKNTGGNDLMLDAIDILPIRRNAAI